MRIPYWRRALLALMSAVALITGCAALDEKQRTLIFQPSDRSWGQSARQAEGMQDVWIEFHSQVTGQPVRLHGLWHPADATASDHACRPLLLFLHGARWNVRASAGRMRRMQALGFSVLAIDYRGFGQSTAALPSEAMAVEDARAAWDWLGRQHPGAARYIFGHSLGGGVAVALAEQVNSEEGVILESTFTSIPDVARTMQWGWLPVEPLITQRFDSGARIGRIGSPVLVVHGARDKTIQPELGQRLYAAAAQPKAFILVDKATHNIGASGQAQYRAALPQVFGTRCFTPAPGQANKSTP
ncbi:MAG: alpha/beta fold hydrolase [Pseudomonadota bacterium]|nr:alpha/beta fold hydrolase [Pseudomonadota bacterium]